MRVYGKQKSLKSKCFIWVHCRFQPDLGECHTKMYEHHMKVYEYHTKIYYCHTKKKRLSIGVTKYESVLITHENVYIKNNENVTLRIMQKKIVTYENLRKTYENKILIF
jgi:hypothetical protein